MSKIKRYVASGILLVVSFFAMWKFQVRILSPLGIICLALALAGGLLAWATFNDIHFFKKNEKKHEATPTPKVTPNPVDSAPEEAPVKETHKTTIRDRRGNIEALQLEIDDFDNKICEYGELLKSTIASQKEILARVDEESSEIEKIRATASSYRDLFDDV